MRVSATPGPATYLLVGLVPRDRWMERFTKHRTNAVISSR